MPGGLVPLRTQQSHTGGEAQNSEGMEAWSGHSLRPSISDETDTGGDAAPVAGACPLVLLLRHNCRQRPSSQVGWNPLDSVRGRPTAPTDGRAREMIGQKHTLHLARGEGGVPSPWQRPPSLPRARKTGWHEHHAVFVERDGRRVQLTQWRTSQLWVTIMVSAVARLPPERTRSSGQRRAPCTLPRGVQILPYPSQESCGDRNVPGAVATPRGGAVRILRGPAGRSRART